MQEYASVGRTLLLAHLYGPEALQAESGDLEVVGLRFCIRPLNGTFVFLAIMDIRALDLIRVSSVARLAGTKRSRRSLHGLGHSMSISKVILVALPKRLRIGRRNLPHIVAKRRKLPSNVVCCHPRFDANQAGW
jgi:hypothetical protein